MELSSPDDDPLSTSEKLMLAEGTSSTVKGSWRRKGLAAHGGSLASSSYAVTCDITMSQTRKGRTYPGTTQEGGVPGYGLLSSNPVPLPRNHENKGYKAM